MAKNTFLSFSTTAGDNTDVGGIGILGTNAVSNFDNALRTLMAILRGDLDNGTVFVTKSAGYTGVAGDNNAFYEFTATATLALTAAATLGADWHMMVFANGGVVTVDPNASELINGATTLTISNGDSAYIICTGSAFKAITFPSVSTVSSKQDKASLTFGQCFLSLSGGSLVLSRSRGRLITINGAHEVIPQAGVSLSPSGLTPSTLYYIYAYMNSGTMTLEASTTGHATDSTTGVEIKSGDSTRTLVGMARPVTGPAWADSAAQRFVRSWFNRSPSRGEAAFTANRTRTSSTLGELSSEIRNEFICWDGDVIQGNFSGWGNVSGGGNAILKIVLDAGSADLSRVGFATSTSSVLVGSGTASPSEGYHYLTMYASTTTGTATVFGTGDAAGLLNSVVL